MSKQQMSTLRGEMWDSVLTNVTAWISGYIAVGDPLDSFCNAIG